MLLAVDIGNSNIVVGVSRNGDWIHQWRIQTVHERTTDEYAVTFRSLLTVEGLTANDFDRVILSSVVPVLTGVFRALFKRWGYNDLIVLDHTTDTGLKIGVNPADTIGSDLIANAVAAWNRFNTNCIVIDFGTATTFMTVKEPGIITGGAIAAGLEVTMRALVGNTAQLSEVPMEPPTSVIGTNTRTAMQSGLFIGHICMIEGLVERLKQELPGKSKVIATGGLSEVVGPHTGCFDVVDSWLTLDGLRIIANRQQ